MNKFMDCFDLELSLREAASLENLKPTQRMIALASIGVEPMDAFYSVRELREAAQWTLEGDNRGKKKLVGILGNANVDDYQRCIYYSLAGRGIVGMLDDLMWLEELLERRAKVDGDLHRDKVRRMPRVNPYVAPEPDGPVGQFDANFKEGSSWYLDPMLNGD